MILAETALLCAEYEIQAVKENGKMTTTNLNVFFSRENSFVFI